MRINKQGYFKKKGRKKFEPLSNFITGIGCCISMKGTCFKTNGISCTVLIRWEEGYETCMDNSDRPANRRSRGSLARRKLWNRPILRDDENFELHRAVTWLELFFDLVFVVVLTRLTHELVGHITPENVLNFVLLFVPTFWLWNAATYYTERFESREDGIETRFLTFLTMIAVAGMAVFSHHGLEENYVFFSLSYLTARVINIGMWQWAVAHESIFRPVARRFLIGFVLTVAIICISFTTEGTLRFCLWGIAIFIEIMTPYFTLSLQKALPPLSTSKFPERFGLFTIIVLGESVVGVINGLSEESLTRPSALNGLLGIMISFGLWWIYFDFIARRTAKPVIHMALFWVYAHLLFLACITMTGAGISTAIINSIEGHLALSTQYLLLSSVGFGLIFLALLEMTLHYKEDEPTHPVTSPLLKALTGGGVLLLSFVNLSSVPLLLSILLIALAIQQVYGAVVWFCQDL